jgi:hypothetical protein
MLTTCILGILVNAWLFLSTTLANKRLPGVGKRRLARNSHYTL